MIMYHHQFPTATQRSYMHRCTCGKPIFRANTDHIMITNDIGLEPEKYPPSQAYIQLVCHSCKAQFTILYQ